MTGRLDIAAVNALLAERMADLARDLVGADPSQRRRDEWRFRGKGSLSIMVGGTKSGQWFDHEAGRGGDPIGLIAHLRRTPMREAFSWALGWLGEAPYDRASPTRETPKAAPTAPQPASRTADLARRIWQEAGPPDAPGSLLPTYLASRGLTLPTDAPLRFHPCAWRNADYGPPGPAMIAAMTVPASGEWSGVHVTYLAPSGAGKAAGDRSKIMLGNAGVIRLVPDEEVSLGLGLAEGIETALAVMQRAGWLPVWAAGSAGLIRSFPMLPGIEALTVFADADGAGMGAARECCRRWADAGRDGVILAPPVGDWDDALPRPEWAA
jgi:putative DNA primase/helicase